MGTVRYTLQDFQTAAEKFRKELLMLPLISLQSSTQYMTVRPGIRYKEAVGFMDAQAEFAPYKPTRVTDVNLDLDFRQLETFFGSVNAKFEPNSAILTLLGEGATKGDGQKLTPSAKNVLALVAKNLGANLNKVLFSAVRNANGDTSATLFNGFDTITAAEIADSKITTSIGNLVEIGTPTASNALDIAKTILYAMTDELRDQECYLYCTRQFADYYNEAYLLSHGNVPFYNKYNQTVVEGSEGNLILCPLSNKKGSSYFQITPKANMLVGVDQMGDVESIEVARFEAFVLNYIATMFFGVQFESIDPRRLLIAKITA